MRLHLLDTMVHLAFRGGRVPEKWTLMWTDIRHGRRSLILVESIVAETYYQISKTDGEDEALDHVLWLKGLLRTRVVPVDDNLAMTAGRLRARYGGKHDLSLADCFALAAARHTGAQLVTTEHGLRDCARELRIDVSWLPRTILERE